jgi:hypothetical protein
MGIAIFICVYLYVPVGTPRQYRKMEI